MNTDNLTRREFLKLQGLAAGGLALAGSGVFQAAQAAESCSSKNTYTHAATHTFIIRSSLFFILLL